MNMYKDTPLHIVIVEDDPDDFELTSIVLGQECPDAAVQHLGSQSEWNSFINYPPAPPSLILMDYRFASLTGLEMLRQLKAHWTLRTTPVLIWSGIASEAEVRACMEAGAAAFMQKPTNLQEYNRDMKAICTYLFTLIPRR